MQTLTEKQTERLRKAEAKLPTGFEYVLHDTNDNHAKTAVWGVTLLKDGEPVGYVGKNMCANCTAGRSDTELQKLLLNRAAAALWHKQPLWTN